MNLLCPHCENEYLHHGPVHVFEREKGEDGDGVKLTITRLKVDTEAVPEAKMPGRRNAVELDFWCETCHKRSRLRIEQHKGVTDVTWIGLDVDVELKPEF